MFGWFDDAPGMVWNFEDRCVIMIGSVWGHSECVGQPVGHVLHNFVLLRHMVLLGAVFLSEGLLRK